MAYSFIVQTHHLVGTEAQELEQKGPKAAHANKLTALRNATIQAMSNLLSANIDSGLMHSISLGYHPDLQTRAAFMEVSTRTSILGDYQLLKQLIENSFLSSKSNFYFWTR